jgi:hypothetical protein
MKRVVIATTLLSAVLGCASIQYMGNSYPPTDHVDLYFSEYDVPRDYTVIGRLVATANVDEPFYSSEKFTEAIRKKGREKGADAVVILGLRKVMTGTTVAYVDDGVISSVEEKRRVEALAIKYEDA